jgi:hypothetical protein
MMSASSCTRPSMLRNEPRPASKVSSSSIATTAASTASSELPPRSSTCQPSAAAASTPRKCDSTMSSGMAHAPPWTRITGSTANAAPFVQKILVAEANSKAYQKSRGDLLGHAAPNFRRGSKEAGALAKPVLLGAANLRRVASPKRHSGRVSHIKSWLQRCPQLGRNCHS